jgi:hypothetical protein
MSTSAHLPIADFGPWNPGIASQVPGELRHLCTIFRPENVSTDLAEITELQQLTGMPPSELVAFRPQRLVLHELLIRVTADLSVPAGSRIEDLGINFRRMTGALFKHHLEPQMSAIVAAFQHTRAQLTAAIEGALTAVVTDRVPAVAPDTRSGLARFFTRRTETQRASGASDAPARTERCDFGPPQIAACERLGTTSAESQDAVAARSLARVLSSLFTTHGRPWGTRELIVRLATNLACNTHGSAAIGTFIEPLLRQGALSEGYAFLPRQERPVIINTKGPSASGKSTLRLLQKQLAGDIGMRWADFALISPDIWRKQLLDYASLGAAYKYAGAFTAEELQIVDQKLDAYMARKNRRGDMSHLLIDRFRFDSFAPDSHEAGSNLLTRFGDTVFLFLMITPPEQLVERAWKRGLEVGRYKAVDDTLAHSVEAYTGMPDVFFTWVRSNKHIQFEFLDNSVSLGELPRTVAFGTNRICNVLDVKRLLDLERFGRVNVDATSAAELYPERALLAPEQNVGLLKRCVEGFGQINFAAQASGRIYLRVGREGPPLVDPETLQEVCADPDVHAALRAVAPRAFDAATPRFGQAMFLRGSPDEPLAVTTLGQWGPRP